MAIVYPLAFPTATGTRAIRLTMQSTVAVSISPFTLQEQVQEFDGQRWNAEVQIPVMKRPNAEAWVSFLAKLNGRLGTFLMGDPAGGTPRGAGGGTPLIMGAAQTGNDIITDGWPATTTVLLEGDYVQFGSGAGARLYKVLDDATTDGGGIVTLTLWPAVRVAFPDNDPLVITNAVGIWRLAGNLMPFEINTALHYGIGFNAASVI